MNWASRADKVTPWILTFGFFLVIAGIIGSCAKSGENMPEQYVVTAKEACLPLEGIPLRLNYNGKGVVDIYVVPPTNTSTTLEKE